MRLNPAYFVSDAPLLRSKATKSKPVRPKNRHILAGGKVGFQSVGVMVQNL